MLHPSGLLGIWLQIEPFRQQRLSEADSTILYLGIKDLVRLIVQNCI